MKTTLLLTLLAALLASFTLQAQVGGRYYADKPNGGPDWGLRFAITLLFPK